MQGPAKTALSEEDEEGCGKGPQLGLGVEEEEVFGDAAFGLVVPPSLCRVALPMNWPQCLLAAALPCKKNKNRLCKKGLLRDLTKFKK